jgi:acetyl-CoA carboxylase carboxyltransferase component
MNLIPGSKKIYLGGGEKAAAKQKEKGKMLAREACCLPVR